MKVNLSISKRIDAQGHSEIMLLIRRRLDGKVIDIRAKSGVFIDTRMFDVKKKAVKTFAANKMLTDEVRYHNAQLKKLNTLIAKINEAYNNEVNKSNVCGKWLEKVVRSANGEKLGNVTGNAKDIYGLFDDYINDKPRSQATKTTLSAVIHSVSRFEMYVRETDRRRRKFTFDVASVTKDDINDYKSYILNEKRLSEEQPNVFKKILSSCNSCKAIRAKGENTICGMMTNLKSFFTWLNQKRITLNKPFDGIEIGKGKYGTPYYITLDERNKIASTQMPTKRLEVQRDIFIFQCFVGCRVSDLTRFTPANITDGVLVYTPHKTKEEGIQSLQARVPLHAKALDLIEKYKGQDKQDRLFPFVRKRAYNNAIRKIFSIAGITRMVEVRNTLTGEIENRPINEVASSHLARRTFVGNLYSKVADPNLIGKMSGHVDGSKAFSRYRKIEDDTLRSVIDLI